MTGSDALGGPAGRSSAGPALASSGAVGYRVSHWQESMWLTDQLRGSRALSAPALCVRARGPLRPDALRAALLAVVGRHEVLRSTFELVDGEPVQVVHADPRLDHAVVDLPGADEDRVAAVCAQEVRSGFDLSTQPPLRSRLYRLGPDHHVWLVVRHHIAFDGRSAEVLVQELTAAYAALAGGREPVLPPLPVQYSDVARWQRARLAEARGPDLVAHWAARLDGVPPTLPLPADRARSGRVSRADRSTGLGRSFAVPLPPPVADGLPALARACRATPFMVLLAAFRLALWRYTGQRGGVVATPVERRDRPETQGLIGCFLDTVLLPARLDAELSGRELVAAERAGVLDAFTHLDLPYPVLARALGHRAPAIQVTFAYQVGEQPYPDLAGLDVTPLDLRRVVCLFDLMAKVVRDAAGLRLQVAYDDDVFDEATVRRLAVAFLDVLERLLGDPDASGGALAGMVSPPVPAPASSVLLWTAGDAGDPGGPPTGAMQVLVADLWAELLEADVPGVEISIFDCGGHSLVVARLVARLREALGIEVHVADLMEHQTVAAQAAWVEARVEAALLERQVFIESDD